MIRSYRSDDIDSVLDIWLTASVKAHDFVAADFWRSHLDSMRDIYIPESQVYVYEKESVVLGFYALHDNCLAALFVDPMHQGAGIGSQLMAHALQQRSQLELTVYKDNAPSVAFYLARGFNIINEQTDEHTGYIEYVMSNQ